MRPTLLAASITLACLTVPALLAAAEDDPPRERHYYFYDLNAAELVALPVDTMAPATLDNGHIAVQAFVFSCDQCKEHKVLRYLQRLTEAGQALAPDDEHLLMGGEGLFEIGDATGDNWYDIQSQEASDLMIPPRDFCDNGERIYLCFATEEEIETIGATLAADDAASDN